MQVLYPGQIEIWKCSLYNREKNREKTVTALYENQETQLT